MDNGTILDELVTDCCVSLFQDYSLPLKAAQTIEIESSEDLLYCGVLGFSGDHIRGTLMLATSEKPLGRTHPSGAESLRSWIAELSNQLLGRIKSRLLRRGVTLNLALPVVIRGKHLSRIPSVDLKPHSFVCEGGLVCVWFDAELAAGLDLSKIDESAETPLGEGTGILF
jgi:hypothetical protein